MKTIRHDRIRRTRTGAVLIRYAVWRKPGWAIVSVYVMTGYKSARWEAGHREHIPHDPDADYDVIGNNMALLWANFNGLGDYEIRRGTEIPTTYHPLDLPFLNQTGEHHELRQDDTKPEDSSSQH